MIGENGVMSQFDRFPHIRTAGRGASASAALRSAAPAIAILLAATLAGCQSHSVTVGAIPDDYRTSHPIILSEREQAVDIPVSRSETRLSVAQKNVVKATLERYRSNGSGIMHILVPSGSENSVAAMRLRDQIVAELRKSGLPSYNIASETYPVPSPAAAAPIRLTYSAMTASTNACGKWPDDMLNDTENRHWANYGCATQNNLAAQLANPADLLGPRARTSIDANKNDATIKTYEDPINNPPADTATWNPETSY